MLNLSPAELDLIIQMYIDDHPNDFKLTTGDVEKGETLTQIYLSWSNRLTGKTREEFDRNPIAFLKKHYDWTRE